VALENSGMSHEINAIIYSYVYEATRCSYVNPSTENTKSLKVKYNSTWTGSGTTWMETYKSGSNMASLFYKNDGTIFSART